MTPGQLADAIRRLRPTRIGFDTETEGCDPAEQSPVYRARLFCSSWALLRSKLSPLGYHVASGFYAEGWENTRIVLDAAREVGASLVAHNAAYDRHVLANEGLDTSGLGQWIDTLTLAQFLIPEAPRHNLKDLAERHLGRRPLGKYRELFSARRKVPVARKIKNYCEACQAVVTVRKIVHPHPLTEAVVLRATTRTVLVQPSEILKESRLYELFQRYAIEDAKMAIELYDWMRQNRAEGHAL